MFRSLRFRLPAFFLAGVVVAGLVSTAIAVKLFQDYTRDRTYAQLHREVARPGGAVRRERGPGRLLGAPARAGDRRPALPDPAAGRSRSRARSCASCRRASIDIGGRRGRARASSSSSRPPGSDTKYLGGRPPGASCDGKRRSATLVVATPESQLQARWLTLIGRLALAFAAGLVVAALLGLVPVPPDHRARARAREGRRRGGGGQLRRRGPGRARRRRDRRPRGPVRPDGRAAQGGGRARADVPDDRLARAADAADRDPRPRRGAARGDRHRRGSRPRVDGRADRPRRRGSSGSSATCSTSRS